MEMPGIESLNALKGTGEGLRAAKRYFRSTGILCYATAFFAVGLFLSLLFVIHSAHTSGDSVLVAIAWLILSFGCFVSLFGMWIRLTRQELAISSGSDHRLYLRERSDRFFKKSVWSLVICFCSLALFEVYGIGGSLGRTKYGVLAAELIAGGWIVAVALFLLLKNLFSLFAASSRLEGGETRSYRRHLALCLFLSTAFWGVAVPLLLFRESDALPLYGRFAVAVSVYFLAAMVYALTLREKVVHRNIVIHLRKVLLFVLAVMSFGAFAAMNRNTWYLLPYINSVSCVPHAFSAISYDDASGVFTIVPSAEDFRILHLTDIHLGGSFLSRRKDLLALKACYREIEYARPDLVIVTGDLCYPVGVSSFSFNNYAPIEQFAAFMRNVGIPWAFAYGNHDTERIALMGPREIDEVYRSLSFKTSASLLYPYIQPNITGRNNQVIEIRRADGSLNTALFVMDSNAYLGKGFHSYDYIRDDQVDWYASEVDRLSRTEGGKISSLLFFHIPLREYRTAYDKYLEGDEAVEYHFGENNEEMFDLVCCSDHESGLFDKMVELGSTKGVFCGHDHYNNISLTYRGVRLTYGMSIDYLAMPGIEKDTAQRGAELITIRSDSSWDVRQIPLTSIS